MLMKLTTSEVGHNFVGKTDCAKLLALVQFWLARMGWWNWPPDLIDAGHIIHIQLSDYYSFKELSIDCLSISDWEIPHSAEAVDFGESPSRHSPSLRTSVLQESILSILKWLSVLKVNTNRLYHEFRLTKGDLLDSFDHFWG